MNDESDQPDRVLHRPHRLHVLLSEHCVIFRCGSTVGLFLMLQETMPLIGDQVTGDANCGVNEKKEKVGAPSVGDRTGSPQVSGT